MTDLNIMTDEDQKVINTNKARLEAGRETMRTIRANAAAGNGEAKAWVENRNLSVSDGKLEATKARREARGGTVAECDLKCRVCGTARKGLKWCQLLCLNTDCKT